jgi:hypothetical protein
MIRKHKNSIKIEFNEKHEECKGLETISSSYPGSQGYEDIFYFKSNCIEIEAFRTKSYGRDASILLNPKKSFLQQIMKALIVYYATAKNFPTIKRITRNGDCSMDFEFYNLNNFARCPKEFSIHPNIAKNAMQENKTELRNILSHWICGMGTEDAYTKFDNYWKALERIIKYSYERKEQKKKNEKYKIHEGIKSFKNLLEEKNSSFTRSTELAIRNLDKIDFKSWLKLFRSCDKKDIIRRLKEYEDFRIIAIYEKIYKNVSKSLRKNIDKETDMVAIENHLSEHRNTTKEIDVLCAVSLSYAYKKRCRRFHAEGFNSMFRITPISPEVTEMKAVADVLSSTVSEAINNLDLFTK